MVRGTYIAGTGMMLQRRRMENVTNNIANVDTTGFRKEFLVSHSFDAVMIQRMNDTQAPGRSNMVGPLNLGTQIDQKFIDFRDGNLEHTGRRTDLALMGDAFFAIETADGERYTRNGAFFIDNLGYLVTSDGDFVLSTAETPIVVGGPHFQVDSFGNVFTEEGELIATLRVVSFEDNTSLRKQGDSLFFSLEDPVDLPNEFRMMQGYLEGSNVDVTRAMVDMLTVFRAYETNQRILSMIDETVGMAVNQIGSLR